MAVSLCVDVSACLSAWVMSVLVCVFEYMWILVLGCWDMECVCVYLSVYLCGWISGDVLYLLICVSLGFGMDEYV